MIGDPLGLWGVPKHIHTPLDIVDQLANHHCSLEHGMLWLVALQIAKDVSQNSHLV